MGIRIGIRLLCLFAAAFLWQSVALAADSIAVAPFTGAKRKTVRDRVVEALENDGVEVVEAGSPGGDSDEAYRALAEENNATAVVIGNVTMSKKGWKATLVVRSGVDGSILGESTLKGAWLPGLLKTIDRDAAAALAPALARATEQAVELEETEDEGEPEAEPEPEPQPVSVEPEADEPADDDDDEATGGDELPVPIGVRAGAKMFSRSFTYNQDVNRNLRPYDISPSPAASLSLRWYPGAHFSDGPAADIGIVGGFERSFGATSSLEGGDQKFDTTMQSYDIGLRYRIRLSEHELGISGRYGSHAFEIRGDEDPAATSATGTPVERDLLPDVSYGYIRPALDARLAFGKVIAGGYAGFRIVQSMGDLQSSAWFPNATTNAVDVGLFGGYAIGGGFGILVGGELVRYGLDMQSEPGDLAAGRDVAGGAVDQYLNGWVGFEWRAGG